MKKYPVFLQDDYMSCGAYCVYMILHYYHGYANINEIKKKARISKNGITMKGIIECFHDYNIESKAYQATLDDIETSAHLPCILHVISQEHTHYVVLYEIKNDCYIIGDPAIGMRKMNKQELEMIYSERMIALTHIGRIPSDKKETYLQFLYNTFLSYKSYIMKLVYKGMIIAVLTYFASLFFRFLADEMSRETHYFYMVLLSLVYGSIQLFNAYISYKKSNEVIKLTRVLDEDYVYDSSLSMLDLPYQFFETDHGYIQSELLSFYDLSSVSMNLFTGLFLDGTCLIFLFLGMCFISLEISMIVLVLHIFVSLLSYLYYQKIENVNKEYIEALYTYQHHLLELIINHFLIHNYGLKRKIKKKSFFMFDKSAKLKEEQFISTNYYEYLIHSAIYIFYTLMMLIGFWMYKKTSLTMGEMLMFYMLVSYSIEPMLSIVDMFVQYERAVIVFEKYKAFQIEVGKKEVFDGKIESITFENVSYAHGYALPLFEHMNFVIDGHTVINGESGSGKTTLLKLIMGYDENYSGNIYINNRELREVDLSSLYKHITYLEGEPSFLHETLYDNFLCDDKDKIISLLEMFHHEELIDMFHIVLNEDGSPLSLGQRQLVSIIRALCKESDVYIFDEAFSHMDTSLHQRVDKYLKKIGEDKIYIEVSHKIKAVKKGWNMITIDKTKKDVL